MSKPFAKSFYRSDEWAAVRRYCLMRDNYLCVKCGRPAEEVHHIVHLTPDNIWDASIALNPDNCVSLCRDCHFKEHRADQANGRKVKYETNVLPKVLFDEAGNPIVPPRVEKNV